MPDQESKQLTDEELARLREADASPELVAIARRDPAVIGRERNSTREQVRTVLRGEPSISGESLKQELGLSGHFFNALFNGKVGEAFVRADITNTMLLFDTFGPDYLKESLIADEGFPPEKAERYVEERIDQYGQGIIP